MFPPEQLDPWLLDTEWFLNELARVRQLALRVPLHADTYAPTNTVVDALWNLETTIRFMLQLQHEGMNRTTPTPEGTPRTTTLDPDSRSRPPADVPTKNAS